MDRALITIHRVTHSHKTVAFPSSRTRDRSQAGDGSVVTAPATRSRRPTNRVATVP
ncbi:hypothetical protein NJ7G_1214 [Natrinema sp. J7-2]|nr:hypothetical protein NJ7G_1214 [Natrinema sp. J7-2]